MELYAIPFQGEYILYRPLRRLAFVGNRAMLRHVERARQEPNRRGGGEADVFLQRIGFWEPDPKPPPPWEPREEHQPTIAVLLMTNACNLRCTYCYAGGGEGAMRSLTVPLACRVIDAAFENARRRNKPHFSLAFHGGGEPTLNWPVMRAAVRHAREKPLPCEITMSSNGLWSKAQRDFVLGNFNALSLSFDGVQPVQDAQRPKADGTGSFEPLMETIRALDEARFPYGIRMTVTAESIPCLPQSVAFLCEATRCGGMQVEPCYSSGRGRHREPSPKQAEAFVRAFLEAFEVAAKAGRPLLYSGARPWVLAASFCRAPEDALVVTPDGDLVTCFEIHDRRHALTDRFVIGRVAPEGIFVDRRAVEAFAGRQAERRAACAGCFCYWHCGGDCATRCMAAAGPPRVRCEVNRAVTRELLAWYIAAGDGVWRGEQPACRCPGGSNLISYSVQSGPSENGDCSPGRRETRP